MRTDGHDETFRDFANTPKTILLQQFGADMAVTFHVATDKKK